MRKHHRYSVNMYMLPHVHPSNFYQGCIKGANLQQSQLWPASALAGSFVLSAVVSASALIIDVSPYIRQAMIEPFWEVCRAAGWGSSRLPLTVRPSFHDGAKPTEEKQEKGATEKASVFRPSERVSIEIHLASLKLCQ